jgi:hypothetical protein
MSLDRENGGTKPGANSAEADRVTLGPSPSANPVDEARAGQPAAKAPKIDGERFDPFMGERFFGWSLISL